MQRWSGKVPAMIVFTLEKPAYLRNSAAFFASNRPFLLLYCMAYELWLPTFFLSPYHGEALSMYETRKLIPCSHAPLQPHEIEMIFTGRGRN